MIKNIVIRDIATFDENGIILNNLAKINFIYGGNGTGKTTISNYLSDMDNPDFSECSCEWEDGDHERIIVYNKKFRENTILNDTIIPGVFTLGEESAEKLKEIADLKVELDRIRKERDGTLKNINDKKDEIAGLNDEMRDWLWTNIYKRYPEFHEAYKGHMQKATFMSYILEILENEPGDEIPTTDLTERYNRLYNSASLQRIEPIATPWYVDSLAIIENNPIWKEIIIGKQDVAIANLVNRLRISDWVHQGKMIIEGKEDDVCPFCQQHTITDDFKNQIDDYFDQNFVNKTSFISELSNNYFQLINAAKLSFENLIQRLESLSCIDVDKDGVKVNISAYLEILSANKIQMESKITEPSRMVSLTDSLEMLTTLYKKVQEINNMITSHNSIVENIDTEKRKLIRDIWNTLAIKSKPKVDHINELTRNANLAIAGLTNSYNAKNLAFTVKEIELKRKESNITSVLPTVNSINETLKQFGFTNFKIVQSASSSNHYQIQREDGTIATNTLSEGEMTFISFLYYMHLIKGSHDGASVSGRRILVIDDPISSLDSDILFVVSSLLKELFKKVRKKDSDSDIRQIILLTHNVYFHKEVSFIDKGEIDSTKYWILRKNGNVTYDCCYDCKNPIKSSYELLWSDLRDHKDGLMTISIQNTMRRILETYFTVFGDFDYVDRTLNRITNKDDKEIARSLLCWANEGSHGPADDIFMEPIETQADRYFVVFKMIFEQLGQIGHYNMMMRTEYATD